MTKSSSPFKENRDYNIPQGDGFHIKKSDKELTKFVEVERGDDTWQVSEERERVCE